jgi:regulator of sigma E protease
VDFSLISQASFSWFSAGSWVAILQMVVGLGFIIFVHELGHFLVAKACGVKCEKFYVGFDAFDIKIGDMVLIPRRLLHVQWGETEYGIGIIPLGGYVKMLGQDDNPANQQRERERTLLNESETQEGAADTVEQETSSSIAAEGAAGHDGNIELDPRSYPAKTVWQRLLIISAGVVMNLIFAVIFAMCAFAIGAPYQPAVIGSTVPGGPAWIADVEPGTRVIQINDNVKPADHIRFRDLQSSILLTGAGHPILLKCEVPGSEAPVVYDLRPVSDILRIPGTDLASIGIEQSTLSQLGKSDPILPGLAASLAEPPLEAGDEIIEVNGVAVSAGHELKRELARIRSEVAEFTVRRKGKDGAMITLGIKVPRQVRKGVGINIGYDGIQAIQDHSPAKVVGLKPMDEIVAVDGQPIRDILLLADQLLAAAKEDRDVELTVQRTGDDKIAEELGIKVKPRLPRVMPESSYGHLPYGIDELGIAVRITPIISSVEQGSSAEKAGLKSGDRLTVAEFLKNGESIDPEDKENQLPLGEIEFAEDPQLWPLIMDFLQYAGAENSLRLTVDRDGESIEVNLEPQEMENVFNSKRGFRLARDEKILKASSVGEAFQLGLRQTKEDAGTVYRTLRQMLIGRLSPINLRGPGTIATAAVSLAMEGLPKFLLFLTLISANLAVVNFLPIPVLDGGHAVFLIYEGIFRRPVPEKMVFFLSMAGLVFILGLMFFVISMDVFQWFNFWG